MGLIKKPSELEVKSTITMLIYGQPGVGKSTLGCSAPNAVLFDYDGGVNRINGAHQVPTVQIRSWEQTDEALREIAAAEQAGEMRCDTIVIDTVGKMLDFMSESIIRNDSRMGQRDGSLQLKGYGVRAKMFQDFIKRVTILGKSVIFIAHEKEEKQQGDITVKRPEIGGKSANDLMKELDLVGYVKMLGTDRTIFFTPTEEFYAKNTCDLPDHVKIDKVLDAGVPVKANDYITRMLAYYRKNQEARKAQTAEYEKLVAGMDKALGSAKDAEDINKLVETVESPALKHVFNSKLVLKQKIHSKATAMHLTFNEASHSYEQAGL